MKPILLAVAMVVGCVGCGGGGGSSASTSAVPAAPAISTFTANQAAITAGTSTTLMPVFSGGTGSVDQGIGSVSSGTSVPTGNLTANTTFTLTVTNSAGVVAQDSVTVVIVPTIAVTPASAKIIPGGIKQFTATTAGTLTPTITWSIDQGSVGGAITSQGLYTATSSPGTYTIRAALSSEPTIYSEVSVVVGGTELSGNITTNTTLDPSGNPYYININNYCNIVNAMLTLSPGVELHGEIVLKGTATLTTIGTQALPIILADGVIGYSGNQSALNFQYCIFSNFELYNGLYSNVATTINYCTGSLYGISLGLNGTISNSNLIISGSGVAPNNNELSGPGGIYGTGILLQGNILNFPQVGTGGAAPLAVGQGTSYTQITNNVFQFPATNLYHGVLFSVTDPTTSLNMVKGNSFLTYPNSGGAEPLDVVGVSGSGIASPITMDWSGNYWGTTNDTIIRSLIMDATVSPNLMITIGIDPILTVPDPNTPVVP